MSELPSNDQDDKDEELTNRNDIRSVDKECMKEEEQLRGMKVHGVRVGVNELAHIIANAPMLGTFLEGCEDVLELSEESKKRFLELYKLYAFGDIEKKDFRELILKYINPFFKEFFSKTAELLNLNDDELIDFKKLKKGYANGSLEKAGIDELRQYALKFCAASGRKKKLTKFKEFLKKISPFKGSEDS